MSGRCSSTRPTALSIARVSPAIGPVGGAMRVSVYGTGFLAGATVTFNGVAATEIATATSGSIVATTPPGALGTADVVVTNPDGKSARLAAGYTYEVPPRPITSIRVTGPDTIAPGATGQFTAIAEYEDGASEDVTSKALWSSLPTGIIALAGPGQARGVTRGSAIVRAQLQQASQGLPVMVLETGTYRLSGVIRVAGEGLAGATIEVLDGIGAGLRMTTFGGAFFLYGVAGIVTVRVLAIDFDPVVQTLVVAGHTERDFELTSAVPSAGIDGTWSLTISASPDCRANLPEPLRERRFTAILVQQGPRVTFKLSAPTLDESEGGYWFTGRLTDRTVSLELPPGRPFFDSLLLEVLPAGGVFALSGTLRANVAEQAIQGTLTGDELAHYQLQSSPSTWVPTSFCRVGAHTVLLRR